MRYNFILLLFFHHTAHGQNILKNSTPQSLPIMAESKIKTALATLANDSLMRHAAWSFRATNIATGEVLAEKEPDMALIPASNMKIVTTAAALHFLGAKRCLKTEMRHNLVNNKENGARGGIAIIGCGDPSLCSQYAKNPMSIDSFRHLIFEKIKKEYPKLNQYATIAISDNNINTETPDTWEIGDLTEDYGAKAKGFNFFDNQFQIQYVAKDSAKQQLEYIQTIPDFAQKWHRKGDRADKIAYVKEKTDDENQENKLKIVWHEDKTWHLDGIVYHSKDTLNLTFAYPFVREHLVYNLADSLHIEAIADDNINDTSKWKTLCSHYSEPMSSLVKTCNEESVNLYAEAFLKIMTKNAFLQNTSQNSRNFIKNWLKQYQAQCSKTYKLPLDGTHFADACGLSRHNLLTTHFMTDFLAIIQQSPTTAEPFFSSLPIAGQTGTLKRYFKDQAAKGNLRAKTGSMTHVLAYSGYVLNSKNEQIAFSIIVNNFTGSTKIARHKLTTFLNVMVE